MAWTNCGPGNHIANSGSTTTDQTCAACESGTFSTSDNAIACMAWQTCEAGTYVTNTPSTTQDRICEACPLGTYASLENQSSCLDAEACAAGTVQTAPGTPTSPPTCKACTAGEYCEGGTKPPITCTSGTWDADANPATACAAWTTCSAGFYVSKAGSPTVDQECTACGDGTFTAGSNLTICSAWQDCLAGTYVANTPSSTTDRTCTACADGKFTAEENQPSCAPWKDCLAGTYISDPPSASADRICQDCTDGTFTNTINLTSCSACNTNGCVYSCTHTGECVGCLSTEECADGLVCTSNECVVPSCGGPAPYFADDFSTSAKGWTMVTDPGVLWQIGPAVAWKESKPPKVGNPDPDTDHSASTDNGIAGTNIGGSVPTDKMDAMAYLVSPAIDTSSGASPVYLEYWGFLNIDKNTNKMTATLDIYNGSTWTNLWTNTVAVQDNGWYKQTFDVTSYRNASFQVRFGYWTTSNGAQTAGGWNIDDVRIANAPTCP
jgi:hypothetical protein